MPSAGLILGCRQHRIPEGGRTSIFEAQPAEVELSLVNPATHQRRQGTSAATRGIEVALGHQGALHPPSVNRFGDPSQVMLAKIAQFKRIAGQAAGRGSDDDLIGSGQSLQTRGEVGRAAHRQL